MPPKLPKVKKPPQPVEIEWLDAAEVDGPDDGLVTVRSVGYHVANEKRLVRIASDYLFGDNRLYHVIPRVHIIRITPLSPETKGTPDETI